MDRRGFLRTVLAEPAQIPSEVSDKPHFRLEGLDQLADRDLASLVPIVHPDVRLVAANGRLEVRPARGGGAILGSEGAESELRSMLDLFEGQATLGEISIALAERLSWDADQAFRFVRAHFIALTRCGVCAPMNQAPGRRNGE